VSSKGDARPIYIGGRLLHHPLPADFVQQRLLNSANKAAGSKSLTEVAE